LTLENYFDISSVGRGVVMKSWKRGCDEDFKDV
jgi:hypothetical protein